MLLISPFFPLLKTLIISEQERKGWGFLHRRTLLIYPSPSVPMKNGKKNCAEHRQIACGAGSSDSLLADSTLSDRTAHSSCDKCAFSIAGINRLWYNVLTRLLSLNDVTRLWPFILLSLDAVRRELQLSFVGSEGEQILLIFPHSGCEQGNFQQETFYEKKKWNPQTGRW